MLITVIILKGICGKCALRPAESSANALTNNTCCDIGKEKSHDNDYRNNGGNDFLGLWLHRNNKFVLSDDNRVTLLNEAVSFITKFLFLLLVGLIENFGLKSIYLFVKCVFSVISLIVLSLKLGILFICLCLCLFFFC